MKILIIGGGSMGKTYATSFLRSHIVSTQELMILEKSAEKANHLREENIGTIYQQPSECVPKADLVILAVKPQDVDILFTSLQGTLQDQQVFLSIMAGIKIDKIRRGLGVSKIIRAMPNLPAQIGMGMTAFTSTDDVTRLELIMVQNLINTTGKTLYVDDETLIDGATAISGSGPAYVFYCMQAFIDAAAQMGFSLPEAELLTWQTFKGAVELFHKNDLTCKEWISLVASRGGTTEAAMESFQKLEVSERLQRGAHAALHRAQELGKR